MGTSVSNLQFLGVPEEAVQAALPRALVGKWSERFVTACPDMAFQVLERKASFLSRKLACTVLSVSMFDGDALSLVLFREGKRLTRHAVNPETGESVAGNPKVFCAGLGLPEELAPKLKRLFADCQMQEEKVGILQNLLGAPLFLRYGDEEDGYLPEKPVRADSGPLEEWAREHPEPPKIKNQCKAELIQEIPDLFFHGDIDGQVFLLRPLAIADEEEASWGGKAGEIIGVENSGGKLAYPLPDGHLKLTQLEDPPISQALEDYLFDGKSVSFDHFSYAFLDGRLVIAADFFLERDYQSYSPYQTVLLHDTAGILPCYLPLTLEGRPIIAHQFCLLPDGGFLAAIAPPFDDSCPPVRMGEPALICYGPDGTQKWVFWGTDQIIQVMEDRICTAARKQFDRPGDGKLFVLNMDGTLAAQCPIPYSPYGTPAYVLGGILYILETLDYQKDALLHRLTPDLRPDGEVLVPYMSSLALSPDGALLYAAGYESGLRVIDANSLNILRDLPKKAGFYDAVADDRNRLWAFSGAYAECYTLELELISRHRLKGDVCQVYRNEAGQVCAITFQHSKYITRVYRFS